MEKLAAIKLTGEQTKVYALPYEGTILIKGAAGSGKTVVAMKRVQHLLEGAGQLDLGVVGRDVTFTTFNKALVADIGSCLGALPYLTVNNIDSLVFRFLCDHGYGMSDIKVPKDGGRAFVQQARAEILPNDGSALSHRPDAFFCDEIQYIKGLGITDERAYLELERAGRGGQGALRKDARHLVWCILERYNELLRANHLVDFDDRVNLAVELVTKPDFRPGITHLVVDEAQDCSLQKLRFLKGCVRSTGSLTLIADMAQRIYNTSFTWKDAGIVVHGSRSWELKRNHRNTVAIAKVAESIRAHAKLTDEYTAIELPERTGEKPELILTDRARSDAALDRLCAKYSPADTIIATWRRADLRALRQQLEVRHPGFSADTIHNLKGRSFKHVILLGMSRTEFDRTGDEEKDENRRNLLYVGVSRATETVSLLCCGAPSPFVEEIDRDLLTVTGSGFKAPAVKVGGLRMA